MSLKRAVECVKRHKSFIVTSHTNLEGDAIGSELAFAALLRSLGKRVTVINHDPIPEEYRFLPGIARARTMNSAPKTGFDCFVTVDCSDLSRCGTVARLSAGAKEVLNIDHHISNTGFGDVNWIEPHASSTSEMVYRFFKTMRKDFDRQTAVLLYTGILTDTGSFRYSNTGSATHEAAAELLRHGVKVNVIYRCAYENIPFTHIMPLVKILSTMRQDPSGRVVWMKIKRSFFKGSCGYFDFSEYVLTFARSIKGTEVAVLFKEHADKSTGVRVNFRSQGKTDVNRIARSFGGGGHRTASGCVLPGTIDDAVRKVIARVLREMK